MEIEQPINDKVKEYCHYCVCKSCEDVQMLQAENAKLNAIIDGYQPRLQRYKDILQEIKELADSCKKYSKILQKIKKYIAKICKEECGYVQKKRCPDCDCRYGAILDLITKAEEE